MILTISGLNIFAAKLYKKTAAIWGQKMLAKPSELAYTRINIVGNTSLYKLQTRGFLFNVNSKFAVNNLNLNPISKINFKNYFPKNTNNYFIKFFINYENK